jgi:magnesium transporter
VFKVIDLPPEGKPEETEGLDRVCPPPAGTIRWIDLVETDKAALDVLGQRFGFHPLALEDCASFELQSKLEEYDNFLFIVLHTITADPDDPSDVQIHEVHAFLTETTLVTVHDNRIDAQELAWRRALTDETFLRHGPDWALHRTADVMVDAIFPLLEAIADELEEVEDSIVRGGAGGDLARIFQIKRSLVKMRRVIRPLRDVIGILTRRQGDPRIRERTAVYFRDVHDHTLRCAETIEEDLALASHAMDAYRSAISNRTNEVVKRLTIVSAIFLPLMFLTGFWGQNFTTLPFSTDAVFYVMLGTMLALPVGMYLWFKGRGLL